MIEVKGWVPYNPKSKEPSDSVRCTACGKATRFVFNGQFDTQEEKKAFQKMTLKEIKKFAKEHAGCLASLNKGQK